MGAAVLGGAPSTRESRGRYLSVLNDAPETGCRWRTFSVLVCRVPQLIASLSDLGVLDEDSLHRPLRAEVAFSFEEAGVDLRRRLIREARLVQDIEHGGRSRW